MLIRTVRYSETAARDHEVSSSDASDAVDLWKSWAARVLAKHLFATQRQRHIWMLYAAGNSYTEIARDLGCSRRRISWAVGVVESTAPAKPCPNPWRRSRISKSVRDPREAYYQARRERRPPRSDRKPSRFDPRPIGVQPKLEDDFWMP